MDITSTLKCNNDCIFCPRQEYLKIIACRSLKDIYKDIEETRKRSKRIVLSGGEITLLEGLRGIIDFCKKKNFREIGIITNGRKLKDLNFARRLIIAGVKDFAVSLYSFNEKIHDLITRTKGSCKETKKGIANILKLSSEYDIALRVNIVLNYWNYREVTKTLDKLISLGVKNFIVAEQIIIDKKTKHLSLKEIVKFLKNIREIELNGSRVCLRGFSSCLFGDDLFFIRDEIILKRKDPFIISERHGVDTLVKDNRKKSRYLEKFEKLFAKTQRCKSCLFENRCLGIQKAYL